jgi:hypothetical protein
MSKEQNNSNSDSDSDSDSNSDFEDVLNLEIERDALQKKLLEIEQDTLDGSNSKKLEELTDEEICVDQNILDENDEEYIDEEEALTESKKKRINVSELEHETRCILKAFSMNIKDVVDEYRGENLTPEIEDEIINYHNNQREILKNDLEDIYRELGNQDFKISFYVYIDKVFETVSKRVERILS